MKQLTEQIQLPQTPRPESSKQSKQIETSNTNNQIQSEKQNQIQLQQKNNHISISYRPYVDGLRTIAVLVVVIYHAFPHILVGGFIGVDVFFVISGYLITGIIVKQSLKDKFSYVDFYSRRIKRIYPALLLVLIFVLFVVSKTYEPSELNFTLKTLSASTLFGANLQVLTHQKGYFDADVLTNPLLHLWSLGVEEQFYIFWPCLIGICLTKFRKYTLHGLSIYAALSFVFGIAAVFINAKFAFYFPLCRFWQMSVGGIISYLNIKLHNSKINEALSIAGTISILITIWIVNEQSLFPGFWALVPTLAAACIIQAGSQPFINKHVLSSKLFVFIGKISYPMYLWHWPLLVFSRYLYPEGSKSLFSKTPFILVAILTLTILTYYLVQNPVRKVKTNKIAIVFLVLMLIVGITSFIILKTRADKNPFDERDDENLTPFERAQKQIQPRNEDYVFRNGKMHPNLSKSTNRLFPTVEKLKISKQDQFEDQQNGGEQILEKKILQGSKYFVKDMPFLHNYEVANEGKQNQLFIVGDSHAMKLSYRFQQLHRDSVAAKTTNNFPTVVSIIRRAYQLSETNYILNFTRQVVKQHKPKRILFACHWIVYTVTEDYSYNPVYKEEKLQMILGDFYAFVKEMQDLGIQVHALTINMHDKKYDGRQMFDLDGVIAENIEPVKRSDFRNRYKRLIDDYESNMKKLNVNLIDLTDNLCWQDTCQLLSPSGYAIYTDGHHYGKFYTRHWVSAVDHLVQF